MSIHALEAFNAKYSDFEPANEYVASDRSYVSVNDSNQGNYSGWLNFNSVSMVGADPKKVLNLSSGFLMMPYGAVAHISNAGSTASFGASEATGQNPVVSTLSKNDAMLLAPKGVHHLFSQMSLSFGGSPIHQSLGHLNFYINEQLKAMNADQQRMFCDLLGHAWDSSESYVLDSNVLERNNTLADLDGIMPTMNPTARANKGHRERILKNNLDLTDTTIRNGLGAAGALAANTGVASQSVLQDIMSPSLVGVYDDQGTVISPSTVGAYVAASGRRICTLVFQYIAVVPLSILSNFIKECPTINSLSGFELRLLPNLSPNNSWSVTYGAAGDEMYPQQTASMQSQGETCPFMLSAVANYETAGGSSSIAGCAITGDACTITVSPYVGYYTSAPTLAANGAGKKVSSASQLPCQLYIPSTNLTDPYMSMLLDNKVRRVLYNDYQTDQIQAVSAYSTVQRLITFQTGRLRKLHILPFLSVNAAANRNNCCAPYQSLVSSAPNTCSFAKISNLNVYLGSVNVFSTPQSMDILHYLNGQWTSQGIANGNDFKSTSMQGLIRWSDFKRCYGSITVDLERVTDSTTDELIKTIQLTFKNDTGLVMDYLVITEYQAETAVDRVSGQVVVGSI